MYETYKITDTSRIELLKNHLDSLAKNEPIMLVYDDDADGLTAGNHMYHALKKLGFTHISTIPKAEDRGTFTGNFWQNLEAMNIQQLIIVDCEPISWRFISAEKLAQKDLNIVVIDHHYDMTEEYERLNNSTENFFLFLHPLNCSNSDAPSQYCCAKFVYDVCTHLVDISNQEWKQCIGIIGDMNIIKWNTYVRELAHTNGVDISENKTSFFTSIYGKLANTIGFASAQSSDKTEEFFEGYLHASKPEELLYFCQEYADVEREYNDVLLNWQKNATYDEHHKLYFVKLELKNMLASILSSAISYINDDYSFFFFQHNGEHSYHISMRSQKTPIHLGNLLKSVASQFQNANGGGHAPAAGGICLDSDIDAFMDKIKRNFEKFKTD